MNLFRHYNFRALGKDLIAIALIGSTMFIMHASSDFCVDEIEWKMVEIR